MLWRRGEDGKIVNMCLIRQLIAVYSGRSLLQIPPSPAAVRLEKRKTRSGKTCCFIRNDFIQSWFQVSDLYIKYFIYYLFNYYYWLFVWFILVQHRFFQKMIQPHLFQMPWNQQFQDLRWWFQKWQGPHSSWRKGSPVAQSLTGVKLPLCRGTQQIMIVFMRVHVSLYSLPPNKLFKTTFHIFPLFQTCFYMFLSFRRYLGFVFEKFCFLKRLSSKESCSVFCVLLLFQHSTPWYFQGPKPQGTQMDSVYCETPVCQNPKKV